MSPPVSAVAGLGLGAVTLVAVAGLLHRTLQPTQEIERYVGDVRVAIDGIARNLAATEALGRTRDAAAAIPALATTWTGSSA